MTTKNENLKEVTVDGITVTIDTRVVNDIRTVRLFGEAQRKAKTSEAGFLGLQLFDRILGDANREHVEEALADADGYVDSEAYAAFCSKVLEQVVPKN